MKKFLFLLLAVPTAMYSQLNFGLKTGISFIGNKTKDKLEVFNLNSTMYYTGLVEYKSDDISGEFNLTYYSASGRNTEIKALIPELDFKYYPVDNFNIKTGIYLNSSSLDYNGTIGNVDINLRNLQLHDLGLMIGMETIFWKGLFAEFKMLIDADGSDDLFTNHLMLGIGYKL